jgi:uncharacterized protein YebE (UPF0316 family)
MDFFDALFSSPFGPLLIFALSAVNVTLMTMRQIVAVRGHRTLTAALGFFQMLFWLVAVGAALGNLDSVLHVLGYAGGYAAGCYLGVTIERRLAIGTSVVQAVFPGEEESERGPAVARKLRENDFAAIETPARGWHGRSEMVSVVVPRRKVERVTQTMEAEAPGAFISVEGVEDTRGGFPQGPPAPPKRKRRAWFGVF